MNTYQKLPIWLLSFRNSCLLAVFVLLVVACNKKNMPDDKKPDLRDFQQVNLVANTAGFGAGTIDTTLKNAWGLSWSSSGIAWVNSQAGHVSDRYTADGAIAAPPVRIPHHGDTAGGGFPTGIVFNFVNGFTLADGADANFLFVGTDGILSGWNAAANTTALIVKDQSSTSAFTGVTEASYNGRTLLYAADFRAGRIDVWDTGFVPVSLPFHDPKLPARFAPFNIQSIGQYLYVTYAIPGANGKDSSGVGLGFVDIFNPDGSFVKRFASAGLLNAPWGLTMTPAGFIQTKDMNNGANGGQNSKMGNSYGSGNGSMMGNGNGSNGYDVASQPVILVGDNGDGHINVFSTDGQFLGQLQSHNKTIVIDDLWALSFGPKEVTSIDPSRLYFTAGPNDETDGLFGFLIKQ